VRYTNLGNSGLKVSVLALGSWLTYGRTVEDRTARECVDVALDAGVNVIDTADVYHRGEAEKVLGELLAGRERRHLVLATKVYFPMSEDVNDRGLSRKHVSESIDDSLRRLGTDYVDLYQCHRFDGTTPVAELVATMGDLVRRGKILYWGVSMWRPEQIVEACLLADRLGVPRPVSNQPVYSLLDRGIEQRVLPVSRGHGLGQIVFSPLAQGVLTGKYTGGDVPAGSRAAGADKAFVQRYLDERSLRQVDQLGGVAADLGLTTAQLALAWVLHTDGVDAAIFGASRPQQVEENVAAADVVLDRETRERIEAVFASAG
jgi:aryl-alcohol dehydrogenase-like predicted oxidoreductase